MKNKMIKYNFKFWQFNVTYILQCFLNILLNFRINFIQSLLLRLFVFSYWINSLTAVITAIVRPKITTFHVKRRSLPSWDRRCSLIFESTILYSSFAIQIAIPNYLFACKSEVTHTHQKCTRTHTILVTLKWALCKLRSLFRIRAAANGGTDDRVCVCHVIRLLGVQTKNSKQPTDVHRLPRLSLLLYIYCMQCDATSFECMLQVVQNAEYTVAADRQPIVARHMPTIFKYSIVYSFCIIFCVYMIKRLWTFIHYYYWLSSNQRIKTFRAITVYCIYWHPVHPWPIYKQTQNFNCKTWRTVYYIVV